jgi:hypothetical protein
MKKILFSLAGAIIFAGCTSTREIQAELVDIQLIKIDTVYRHRGPEMLLTWRCKNNVEIVTFGDIDQPYRVGTIFQALVTR